MFPSKNSPNIAKGNNHIFPGKRRGDKALILTYLDSPMAHTAAYYFWISVIFRGKRGEGGGVKDRPKVLTLGRSLFINTQILQRFFKQCFCLLEYYLWWEFRQYWTIFGRVRSQKPPKRDYFVDAASVRKTWKIFNFTTTNAILI